MNFIMDYGPITIILAYIIIFFAPIILSTVFALLMVITWMMIIIYPLLQINHQHSYQKIFLNLNFGKPFFILGRTTRNIQNLLAKYSNNPLLSKVDIAGLQKKFTNFYIAIVEGAIRGMIDGISNQKIRSDADEPKGNDWEKMQIKDKIFAYLLSIFMGTIIISIFTIIICFPVVILILLQFFLL